MMVPFINPAVSKSPVICGGCQKGIKPNEWHWSYHWMGGQRLVCDACVKQEMRVINSLMDQEDRSILDITAFENGSY